MDSYLFGDATHRIRLNTPFEVKSLKADGSVTSTLHPAYDESDHWVDILDELSEYDRRSIMSAAEQIAFRMQDTGPQVVKFSRSSYESEYIAMFKTVIKGWSLPLPLTEETFKKLRCGRWLAEAIDAHYSARQLTEDHAKNSPAGPETPTLPAARSPESSPPSSLVNGSASHLTPLDISASVPIS